MKQVTVEVDGEQGASPSGCGHQEYMLSPFLYGLLD